MSRKLLRSLCSAYRGHAITLSSSMSLCVWALALAGCNKAEAEKAKPKPTEVMTENPVRELVTEHEEFTGRLVAVDAVDVRARVSGYLDEVLFKDGEDVHAGQPLFKIDPRPYQAELERTQAMVDQLQARVEKLKRQEERAQKLLSMKSISQEDFETIAFDRAEAQAGLAGAVASRDLAKLNLSFTRISAQTSGRMSRKLVDPGNMVLADNTILGRVVSLDPIHAYFDVDERTVLRLQRLIRAGKIHSARDTEIPIRVALADEQDYSLPARFNFLDNQVDAATGTLMARAEIANRDQMLSPGLFVRLRVPIGEPRETLLVHEEALGTDQGQRFVYVVDENNRVEYRRVKVGWQEGDRRVIEEGLSTGDRVILTNLQRIRPKDEVNPKPAEPTEHVASTAGGGTTAEAPGPTAAAPPGGGAR